MATTGCSVLEPEDVPSLTDDDLLGPPRVKRGSLQAARVKSLAEELWEHFDTILSHGSSSHR